MKMSLSGEGSCSRSYRSQLAPGVTNEVSLAVKLNATGRDMLVLMLQESGKVSDSIQEYHSRDTKYVGIQTQ
jgi:hypothetical protein